MAPSSRYFLHAARSRLVRSLAPLWPAPKRPPVVVLDPGLVARFGHHKEFAAMIRAELGRDHRVVIYTNLYAATGVLAELQARPVFYDDVYIPAYETRDFAELYAAMSDALVAGLGHLSPADLGPDVLAIMHTATVFQIGGLARWYASLPAAQRPKLFLQFQYPLAFGVRHAAEVPKAIAAARDAAAALVRASSTVRFTSNSDPLSAQLSEQLGQPFSTIPVPIRWPRGHRAAVPDMSFGFFGGLRREKGAMVLADAMPAFLSRHPDVRVLVHAPPGASDDAAVERLAALPQVELIRREFGDKEAYYEQFRRARCILLPYDQQNYAIRTSGVILESLGLGKPVVTTDHTWLASEVRRWGGRGFFMPTFTPDALLDALEDAHRELSGLQEPDRLNEPVMAEYSPASFCRAIVETVERKPGAACADVAHA
ncbi:MAG TPA: glycosyltransferase [Vicinamibacterales bacterium]|nr:glycosyltransferase [Vicinamibacterales bacterium]